MGGAVVDVGKDKKKKKKMHGSPGRSHRGRRTIGIGGSASMTARRTRVPKEDLGAVVDVGKDTKSTTGGWRFPDWSLS